MSIHSFTATVTWVGDLADGHGRLHTGTGSIHGAPICLDTRLGDATMPGTSPEELLASAHASCYAMDLMHRLEMTGFSGGSIRVQARCDVEEQMLGGLRIRDLTVDVEGDVEGISEGRFRELTQRSLEHCPMSRALFGNVNLHVDAHLTARHAHF